MKTSKQTTGDRGEAAATSFLLGEGHRILRRNWRTGHLELDIISLKDNVLHIVEVKTRAAGAPVEPEFNVGFEKRRRMVRAAGDLLHCEETELPCDEVQFDVLSVVFEEPEPLIEYYPQAFIPVYTSSGLTL